MVKFAFIQASPMMAKVIQPDFSICDQYSDQRPKCNSVVTAAYKDANKQCSGYINKLNTCSQAVRRSPCTQEQQNVDGCVNAIVSAAVKKNMT
jgi:hypothetical protein